MRARSHRLQVLTLVTAAFTVLAAGSLIFAAQRSLDPQQRLLVGTWNLNLAKSRYTPGPPPKSESRIYRAEPEGLKGTIRRVYADGHMETIEYLANFDSVYPVIGAVEYDEVRLKKIDDHTSEAVLAHAGRVFGFARRLISNDAKTMTITFRRESDNALLTYVAFYDKVAP
jgi:hypothetical protein